MRRETNKYDFEAVLFTFFVILPLVSVLNMVAEGTTVISRQQYKFLSFINVWKEWSLQQYEKVKNV